MKLCKLTDCEKKAVAWGYCDNHYRRWKQYGDPLAGPHRPRGSVAERFWPKVDKNGPLPARSDLVGCCWLWTAAKDKLGYGCMRHSNERPMAPAHRIAYELTHGPVDSKLDIDHLCRTPSCVNPNHLEPVSHRENMLRGETFAAKNVAKTHCPHGHAYDEANTRWKRNGTKRDCRRCDAIRQARKRDAARARLTP